MTVKAWKDGAFTRHDAALVVPVRTEESVMIQLCGDNRLISEIAADFEGVDEIEVEGGETITGYSDVIVACRLDPETVQVRIKQKT